MTSEFNMAAGHWGAGKELRGWSEAFSPGEISGKTRVTGEARSRKMLSS